MLINLLEPVRYVIKSLLVGAVVDQNDPHSPFVVSLSNGSESLLASSIPDLQLHSLIIDVYLLYLEVNS
jgi:hypothetical protein